MHPITDRKNPKARRRASMAIAALALMILPGVMAGAAPGARTLLDAVPDPTRLEERYRAYELQAMDPYLYRAQLATGEMELTLRGETFRVLVEKEPLGDGFEVVDAAPDGTVTSTPFGFQPELFTGRVDGEPTSRAYFIVTGSGVAGLVQTPRHEVRFDPVMFGEAGGVPGVSVVYRAEDLVALPHVHDHGETVPPAPVGGTTAASSSDVGAQTYAPGPTRALALFADNDMTLVPGYRDRIVADFLKMNVEWRRMVGFQFTQHGNDVFTCSACVASSDGTLLVELAGVANQAGQPWSGHDAAFLHTGRTFAPHGAAWQPGRYGYVAGNTGDTEYRARIMAHELGHAFGSRHEWGERYRHVHPDGSVWQHSTIMTVPDAWPAEEPWEFSSRNVNWIRGCNNNVWHQGGRVAAADFTTFGAHCGYQRFQRGGATTTFEAANFIGKRFAFAPGRINEVCVYASPAGSTVSIAVKPAPDATVPMYAATIQVAAAGWNCIQPQHWTWNERTLFVYKEGGTASIGYDTAQTYDAYASANGNSWTTQARRYGFKVDLFRTTLPVDACGTLTAGKDLARGASITSCAGGYRLTHQSEGNLVLYDASNRPLWSTATHDVPNTRLAMQTDGNLVFYVGSAVHWASNTAGSGAWLSVRGDGRMVVYGADGSTLWMGGCGLLWAEQKILRGGELRSCDGRTVLTHQADDGNIVLRKDGNWLWDEWTHLRPGDTLKMQSDGNLVLYSGSVATWSTQSGGNDRAHLRIEDGRATIYGSDGRVVWTRP